MPTFNDFHTHNKESIELMIRDCDKKGHNQQIAYSVHLNRLTQICFDCREVRYNE